MPGGVYRSRKGGSLRVSIAALLRVIGDDLGVSFLQAVPIGATATFLDLFARSLFRLGPVWQ